MYVIGTAGHVDHGKSTLVHALSGIDPDRLAEEKARGMTIDLGFAWLTLPSGADVSVVDVPGHERFIKNMLAGVGGIDLALLVVAADEGVMPQTREHLAILDLLDVQAGVVAVTKSDLVDEEWLELVMADISETLAGTSLEGAPLVACSATTGAGIDTLLRTLDERLATTPRKRDIGRPRLAVDRTFTIAGFGTVVTGTLIDGSFRVGQEVEVAPRGLRSRIRGLQTHRTKVEVAHPGSRVAMNLTGLATTDVQRGDVVTTPGWLMPTSAVDVRLETVRDLPRPLKHNASVSFHTAAAEVGGKVRLLDANEVGPGETAWAQIRLDEPVALVMGDSFVIRSPNETLGGGRIVDPRARRHRRHDAHTLETLSSLAEGTPEDAIFALIDRLQPVTRAALARQTEVGDAGVAVAVDALIIAGRVTAIGDGGDGGAALLFTTPGFARLTERAQETIAAYLREHPLRAAMSREELRSRTGLQARTFAPVLARWLADRIVVDHGGATAPPDWAVTLSPAQEREAAAFIAALEAQPYAPQPPSTPAPDLLAYLAESGRVAPVADGVVFAPAAYQTMVDRIRAHLEAEGSITLAQVRDLFGTSRKYAQGLLEHLDERRITRRVGDERVLR